MSGERDRWEIFGPRGAGWVCLGIGVAITGAGVWMTVASGGRGDTPLAAFGPMTFLLGAWVLVYLTPGCFHWYLKVEGDTYEYQARWSGRPRVMRLSETRMVRGVMGPQLMGIRVTDQDGRRRTMPTYNQPHGMIEHIAARLLASDADIDPESRFKLASLAGIGATDPKARGADPYVRLSTRGRVRLRRGADLQMFIAAFLVVLGSGLTVLGMNTSPRTWVGLPFLAVGLLFAALALRTKQVDKRRYLALRQAWPSTGARRRSAA